MDRINCLPDDILCHILSFLPAIEAVTTSILSRRWRHLWKDLQVIDINDDDTFCKYNDDAERHARFRSFVNAILSQRNAHSCPVQKFRLSCHCSQESISTWLDAVIGPSLQELHLDLYFIGDDGDAITLPEGIFTCPSLKSLVLTGYIGLYDDEVSNVYLPSLKNLEVRILYVDIHKILSGCPALENVNLDLDGYGLCIPKLQMPQTLKRLTLLESGRFYQETEEISVREIYTPSLEYLNLSIYSSEECAIQVSAMNFPNMVEAHLSITECADANVGWVLELIQALSQTKLLALKNYTTECLFRPPGFEFPEFHRLLNLELDVPWFNKSFLLNLLHNCPVLERLLINIGLFETMELEYNGPTPPTMVPNCVTSHLKSFEYIGYQDSADEHEFIACVLQSGLVLKTVTIHLKSNLDQATKYVIVMILSAIPKGSTTCHLNFIGQNPN
ncbi:hypothetical protein PIB30_015666 [Stylosanthes scabra]|uniref:F-box domain-containing protein n=1 Tax=Stylosanthes scabra TaxID=79078 RepID=A0ABU6T6W8_9FABA|nr:hypothetical protein [Stylosanthes scabra]